MNAIDPRPLFVRALDQAEQLIGGTDPDHYNLQTPCDDYDVRTLENHLLSVLTRIDLALRGGDPLTIPVIATGVDDIPASWKERRTTLDGTIANDAVLEQICTLPWGTLPGAAALAGYTGELTTHAWDLAKATGRLDELDQDLAAQVLPIVRRSIPAEERGGRVPFGPVVQVADDASPYDQLAAWQGRQP
ncbi:TIGR03086 family metal-binding protein [Kribbella solani]|uniref:Uncharacterized protein (TIGR03086 family) n=1 Tax=Kribbella solani TaxID=236067 RepID=A0A841DPJ2_9ACTN|nr:TIGR03086 family metal-binding protein [Kribbella solani]MBB5979739.1 uncharacterized protein (TIGR03086 family) [Kribbella solani]